MGDIAFQSRQVKTLHVHAEALAHVPPSTVVRQNTRYQKKVRLTNVPQELKPTLS